MVRKQSKRKQHKPVPNFSQKTSHDQDASPKHKAQVREEKTINVIIIFKGPPEKCKNGVHWSKMGCFLSFMYLDVQPLEIF